MQKISSVKKIIILFLLYTIFILNSSIFYIYAQEVNTEITSQDISQDTSQNTSLIDDSLSLIAETAVLIDAKTGIVLYDKDMNKKMYPASTTKILTALIALENSNPTDIVKHSHNAVYNIGPGSSNMGMKENEEISMKDALYGVILKSANEVCMAIAEYISGDVDSFVNIMNEKAKKIGANNTHFANPHGYHDENHYTTSYDMALIMKEAIKNEEFIKLISTKNYTVPKTALSDERLLTASNKLILENSPFYYEYCVGGKTGFTDQAGNTFVSYAEKGDIELISVVMKSKGTEIYNDTKKLFEYGFNLYSEKSIFEKSSFKLTSPVEQIFKDKSISLGNVDLLAKNDVSLNLPNNINLDKIEKEINLESPLIAPIKAGDTVGNINLMYEGNILASVDIIADSEVNIIPEKKLERKEKLKKLMLLLMKIILVLLILTFIIIIIGFISRNYFRNKRKKHRKKYKRR